MNSTGQDYIIYGGEKIDEAHPKGLGWLFYENMKKWHNRISQIDSETGNFTTFGDLLSKCISTAIYLRKLGINENHIISICSYNQLDSCIPFISSQFLGCKVTSFDPTLSKEDTKLLMKQVEPSIIFISDNAIELIEKVIQDLNLKTKIVLFGENEKYLTFKEFLKSSTENSKFVPVTAKSLMDTAIIVFSSGTTGFPKGICLNHHTLSNQARHVRKFSLLKDDLSNIKFEDKVGKAYDIILSFASIYWISTILITTESILNGFCRLIAKEFDAEKIWKTLKKWNVSILFLPPHQLIEMVKEKPNHSVDLPNLREVLTGGSPISKEHLIRVRKALPTAFIKQGCGQTEICGIYTAFDSNVEEHRKLVEKKPESIGKPIKGFTYKVVDTETEETLGPYKQGELRVKSTYQMNGYYNIDSSDSWDKDGFLKTGDIVYYDKELCFYHVDRIKEMLKYKSWHVAPASIETVLHQHPAVCNGVVIGIPHPIDGDHPCAFVTLKNSATSEEILEFVNSRVEDRKKLRGGVFIVNELPVTPSGKIKRRELRNEVLKYISKAG